MMQYRRIEERDVTEFWTFLNTLDAETAYMMYEPGEREERTGIKALEEDIKINTIHGDDFLMIAEEDSNFIGYIRAERGRFNRIHHTAYVVTGILKQYCGQGIVTVFFQKLDKWAEENKVTRLELTVECSNKAAIQLYEKSGFKREGTRVNAMLVAGHYVDEFYMAKIL